MRYRAFFCAIAFTVMMWCGVAAAQDGQGDWYDDTGIYLVHDVDRHFYDARVDLLEKSYAEAAEEIRTAAGFIKMKANRSSEEAEKDLMASYEELKKLADKVQRGSVDSVEELNTAFAHAHTALAMNNYMQGEAAWKMKDQKNAGSSMRAAAMHLERAVAWTEYEGEKIMLDAAKAAATMAEKMLKKDTVASGEVDKAIKDLGKAIERLSKKEGQEGQ
ncbi:hypothetical protein HZA56_19010 [Candidatus Poribacteria bacterium]|nr:hypothetical protein [Candidatus Poribacteria bacterium]